VPFNQPDVRRQEQVTMRKALTFVAKAAVSGLLLYLALDLVNIDTVRDRLSQIDPLWLLAGLAIVALQVVVLAVRWELIVIRCGTALTIVRAFRYSMIAAFFNQTLPSSVGGDAIRIWLVGKHANWRAAAYSVFLDRVIGVVALASVVVVCLPWTLVLIKDPVGRGALLVIGFGFLAAGVIFVALASKRLRFLQHWSPTRHLAAVATVAADTLRTPASFIPIYGLSVFIHLLTVVATWCAARSVGANVPIHYLLFLVLPVVLISIVPISIAGWGVREGAMVAAFAYAGLPQSDGLIISLLFGAIYLALGAAGGLVWVLSSDRADRTAMKPLPDIE
jgi:glycosyltransferase 2 family protein